jgi:cytochrome c oxidase subunit II
VIKVIYLAKNNIEIILNNIARTKEGTFLKKLIILLAVAALILALAACGEKEQPTAQPQNAEQEITIKAKNFAFDQPEYHVKKGKSVKVTLVSEEGIHGVNIKEYKINLDSKKSSQVFTPDKEGNFSIVCSIPCGTGHGDMKATLVVE